MPTYIYGTNPQQRRRTRNAATGLSCLQILRIYSRTTNKSMQCTVHHKKDDPVSVFLLHQYHSEIEKARKTT